MRFLYLLQITRYSPRADIVKAHDKIGCPPTEYAVMYTDTRAECCCGFEKDMLAPCEHALACLAIENRSGEMYRYFDVTLQKSRYSCLYRSNGYGSIATNHKTQSCLSTLSTTREDKRRGRPKTSKRHEIQSATLLLDEEKNKQIRM